MEEHNQNKLRSHGGKLTQRTQSQLQTHIHRVRSLKQINGPQRLHGRGNSVLERIDGQSKLEQTRSSLQMSTSKVSNLKHMRERQHAEKHQALKKKEQDLNKELKWLEESIQREQHQTKEHKSEILVVTQLKQKQAEKNIPKKEDKKEPQTLVVDTKAVTIDPSPQQEKQAEDDFIALTMEDEKKS